jgi:hypothetical protein
VQLCGIVSLLTVAAMAIRARLINLDTELNFAVPLVALVVFAAFAVWGCIANGQTEAISFGPSVAA